MRWRSPAVHLPENSALEILIMAAPRWTDGIVFLESTDAMIAASFKVQPFCKTAWFEIRFRTSEMYAERTKQPLTTETRCLWRMPLACTWPELRLRSSARWVSCSLRCPSEQRWVLRSADKFALVQVSCWRWRLWWPCDTSMDSIVRGLWGRDTGPIGREWAIFS